MNENNLDLKKWKSGRHEKLGRWPEEFTRIICQGKRFRQVCPYCMKHKRTCPVCAGVI